MNIRELNLFFNLSSTLHFGQFSRSCNITRSGLTRTIQRLEQELGEQLFLRDNRSVVLTRAGELFRDYAEDDVSDGLANQKLHRRYTRMWLATRL